MARRLETGGAIDRSQPIDFTFDGRQVRGYAGDTVASALLGAGIDVVGRSFKYHRPRGVWGHWTEEPNAILDLVRDGRCEPNARATTSWLAPGVALTAFSVNATPDAARDRYAFLDAFARFLPAGFYYKTFMWPNWATFEPRIRAMAGLGQVDPASAPPPRRAPRNAACDVLVIGAGPAGLAAAATAAQKGRDVWLIDDRPAPGGSLLWRGGLVEGEPAAAWIAARAREIAAAGGRILSDTTAYGLYDHRLAGLYERGADRIWHVRAKEIVVAAGAIERPIVFANNDRPGVLSAEAALVYLVRYGVLVGARAVIGANNDRAYETAVALRHAGAAVTVADARTRAAPAEAARAAGIVVREGARLAAASGRNRVTAVSLSDGRFLEADAVLVSGGFTPTVHLHCQAKGTLRWDESLLAFVPDRPAEGVSVIGAADGVTSLETALAQARAVTRDRGVNLLRAAPVWPEAAMSGRAWIDLQNDVTLRDVRLAAQESYASVEHLKRYTTLGMATDQGKTSNVNGIAALGAATGRAIGAVGATTYRPPYTPVSLAALAGLQGAELMSPVRRLPLEARHRALGAVFGEYGGWLRPAYYGEGPKHTAVEREARTARETVAIFDASPLGKIEVMGPDAATFMDFNSYVTLSTLKPGRLRYGLMLDETGVVFDDGVTGRLDAQRFLVSCSSSHVVAVQARLDTWRQDQFDPRRLFIHNTTAQWATLAVTGPRSRELVERLDLGLDLSDAALPHMAFAQGRFAGGVARVARVSFTGDRCYEISAPSLKAEALLDALLQRGRELGVGLLGIESLMILRAEKGYLVIGKDTDGTTLPHDLGFAGPREKRSDDFIGKRSLFTEAASAADRRQWVGFEPLDDSAPLPCGAHVVPSQGPMRSQGFVTSSYQSPTLGRPIALGLVERGFARMGEAVALQHLGRRLAARIVAPCAFDPNGERLHA